MCLMALIIDVFRIKKRSIIAYVSNTALLIFFYWLLLDSNEVIYPVIISMFIFIVYFFVELIKYQSFEIRLSDAKMSPNYKDKSLDLDEQIIFSTIKDIHNDYTSKLYNINTIQKSKDSLFSQWIHNLKTSITVIDLACEKGLREDKEQVFLQDIIEENNKLKVNLEQCLNVLRLEDFSRDYLPGKVNLFVLINEVVNSKKREFIYRGVYPKVDIDKEIIVYTDKKWCSYMVEQVLGNAIKYSKSDENKKVYIKSKEEDGEILLKIKDEGCGIDIEDMPRIFDAFFTGNNGRKDKNATGIGLYMVKLISDKLGHSVNVESKKGKGTEVEIKFLSKM